MPLYEALTALRRCWYVVVVGLLATLAVGFQAMHAGGLYAAQQNVVLIAPATETQPNTLENSSRGLIATAGLIEREIDQGRPLQATVSPDVPLYGQGVREGYSVIVPSTGGQWQVSFASPILSVQAVSSSPESVRAMLAGVRARVDAQLTLMQDADAVAQPERIRTDLAPAVPSIRHITGSRTRALAAVMLLGVLGTAVLAVWLDRVLATRRRRRAGVPALGEA